MRREQLILCGLLIASIAFLLIPTIIITVNWIVRRFKSAPYRRSEISRVLVLSACLLGATWCLRFAVGRFAPVDTSAGLHWWEEAANSILHALQTFSMDEDYTQYIVNGKKMMELLPVGDTELWKTAYGIYASVLNVLAPIAGGVFIFDILAGVFPKIKLALLRRLFWKDKCFFSGLNEASAALAESICDYYTCTKKKAKPVLIFTDTCVDGDNDKINDLLVAVRRVGAVCVRDDLTNVTKATWGKRKYYLIDEDEQENLRTFVELADGKNIKYIKKSEIYLFVNSDAYVRLEKQVRRKLENAPVFKKERVGSYLPTIIPVRCYRNLIHNLLVDVPLYEPIVHKESPGTLNVTIFGNGTIGTEAFLGVYWMGQMLDRTLCIHVVSQDSEKEFWNKIDYINPEIRKTVQELNKPYVPDDILLYNDTQYNPPYCQVRYVQADVKIGGFWNDLIQNDQQLLDTDYFIVSLGSDADNIAAAEKIRCMVGKKQLESGMASNTVIAYAVFNSALCNTLNEKKYHYSLEDKKTDIYMYAFGSLKQVYSCDNLLMTKYKLWAEETGVAYEKAKKAMRYAEDSRIRGKNENADYNYWANLARAMHIKYKVFSLGWIQTSLFDYADEDACTSHREKVKAACARYKRVAITADGPVEAEARLQMEQQKHRLAWLEHRRWNAYTRTMGYQYTSAIEANLKRYHTCKNMRLKLHHCLVESAMPNTEEGARYILEDFCVGDQARPVVGSERKLDRLDRVSRECQRLENNSETDYKRYDYYKYEYDSYSPASEVGEMLKLSLSRVIRLCKRGTIKDAVHFSEPEEWYMPVESVKNFLKRRYRTHEQVAKRAKCKADIAAAYCKERAGKAVFVYAGDWFVPWYQVLFVCIALKRRKVCTDQSQSTPAV